MAADTVRDLKCSGLDLVVEGGDLQLARGAAAIVQSVRIAMGFFAGEWFLDLDAGVPYYQEVLVKTPNINVLQGIFKDAILSVPGISDITTLNLSFDAASRTLTVEYTAVSDVGLIGSTEVL